MKTLIFWASLISVLYVTVLKPMEDKIHNRANDTDAKIEKALGN
jgi:hypothetical protein